MAQPPVRDYLPASWTNLARVKAEHFCALAHYHAAMALCESYCECVTPHASVYPQRLPAQAHGLCPLAAAKGELSRQEHIFQPSTTHEPQGPALLQHPEERRKLGEASQAGPWAKQNGLHSHSATDIPGLVGTAESRVVELGSWGHSWGQLFLPLLDRFAWQNFPNLANTVLSYPVVHTTTS